MVREGGREGVREGGELVTGRERDDGKDGRGGRIKRKQQFMRKRMMVMEGEL